MTALAGFQGMMENVEPSLVLPLYAASFVLFVALTVCLCILLKRLNRVIRKKFFKSKELMTDNELEFFGRLRRALPEYSVFPQVAMAGIIDTTLSRDNPEFWNVRRRFAQKICDFVISTRSGGSVIAVIELDDRTHDAQKDAERDAMLREAGIRTLRFESRNKPTEEEIRERLLAL